MILLRIYLGYLNPSTDDLEIVSIDAELIVNHLKNKMGTEWKHAYVDIWENDFINKERIPLDQFLVKYSKK